MRGISAAVAGATGLVGGHLLARLLADPEVERVIAPTREPLAAHPKLVNPAFDSAWPALAPLDEAYCCLGTTRKKAGSAEGFRSVDLGLALSFSKAAQTAGARRFGLVSSTGADSRSPFLYPRTKGECEAAVTALGLGSLAIARPSFLLGERAEPRPAERLAAAALGWMTPALVGPLRRLRPVSADAVAQALIAAVRQGRPGARILESESFHRCAPQK